MMSEIDKHSSDDEDDELEKLKLEKKILSNSNNTASNSSKEIKNKNSGSTKEKEKEKERDDNEEDKKNNKKDKINNLSIRADKNDSTTEIMIDQNDPSNVRKRLQKEILTDYIYPDNVENLKTLLTDRKNYSKLLQAVRIMKLIIAAVIIPSLLLSETKFPNNNLGYAATILSFFVSFLEITDRIIVQSNKKRREKINLILKSLGIEYQVPELTYDDPTPDKLEGSVKKNNS
jgi:hypothetical protein